MNKFLYDYWKHGINRKYEINEPWHRDGFITILGPLSLSLTLYATSLSISRIRNYGFTGPLMLLALSQVRPILNYSEYLKRSNARKKQEEKLEGLVKDGSA